jgi:hypothetical protein
VTPDYRSVTITGIGSVSPYGPLAGLIPPSSLQPTSVAWKTAEPRRAFLVPPFRPANVVPGLKTRRLDRLSVWALVASAMALKDAGIDLSQMNRSRIAVVFATVFGCVELTEAFYVSAANNGWHGTDPITFPETLASAPASHLSLFHGLRGPNITVSNKHFAGESAMIQAASLLRLGQADLSIVLAGEALASSIYSWYEEVGLLSPSCYDSNSAPNPADFVPSEGVAALVMESSGRAAPRPDSRSYARICSGRWTDSGKPAEGIRQMFGSCIPTLVICSGNGAPCAPSSTIGVAREIFGANALIIPSQQFAQGLAGAGALFHLILALSSHRLSGQTLLLGTARDSGFAALFLELS